MSSVQVSQSIAAKPERVYQAWLDPQQVGQWMFGPKLQDEEILHLQIDPKVGGRFSFLVRRGDKQIDHVGEYLELKAPQHLAFTWGIKGNGESRVNVDIQPEGEGCLLTLNHELAPGWEDFADKTREGWTKMLGVLKQELEFGSELEALLARAAQEAWSYPKTFDALKDFGVRSYETDVPAFRIVYRGDSNDHVEEPPPNFQPHPLGQRFDNSAFERALKRSQRREINYPQFLREIAAAGVRRYRVDMAERAVSYFGVDGEVQVEPVPPLAP